MLPTRQLTPRNHREKQHGEPHHFRKAYLVLLRVEIARFTRIGLPRCDSSLLL